MTSDSGRRLVFLDADVLSAPLTRTLLLVAHQHGDSAFAPRWSLAVEAEADRHARPGQTRISAVRQVLDWGDQAIVPDASATLVESLVDTDQKDRHVLAAAHKAGIRLIVTRNVGDFGEQDLTRLAMAAVHPDQFLAVMLGDQAYQETLRKVSARRSRDPNTPEGLHAALAAGHPRLFASKKHLYPDIAATTAEDRPSYQVWRGGRCIVCLKPLAQGNGRPNGVCDECSRADNA
jgi:hypothetical protein